jgi:hypothetical protein
VTEKLLGFRFEADAVPIMQALMQPLTHTVSRYFRDSLRPVEALVAS